MMTRTSLPVALVERAELIHPDQLLALQAVLAQISEPNRLRIFALLARGELCVCDIETSVGLPQNLVSHHLRSLREAGLIQSRRDGRWVHYSINKRTLAEIYPVACALLNPDCVNEGAANC
jgi:DNA-binding transcriptional ArsR family regulator